MQILIALCSDILKTMTVVIFGGPWWFDHILWKLESMMVVERCESVYKSAFLQGHPSEDLLCETLVCLSQSCITYLAPLF